MVHLKKVLIGCCVLGAPAAFGQIVIGQVDTFQDATLMGWSGGSDNTNAASGGPLGATDRFLQINSDGAFGPGGVPAVFNTDARWRGNYSGTGVTAIAADLRNQGNVALEMRLVIFGNDGTRWTSTNPFSLAVGSGWQHAVFSVSPSAMTLVAGTGAFSAAISDVSRMMIRNDVGTPSQGGTRAASQVGMDNITAVPEPATMLCLAGGVAALLRRRKSSRSS